MIQVRHKLVEFVRRRTTMAKTIICDLYYEDNVVSMVPRSFSLSLAGCRKYLLERPSWPVLLFVTLEE